MTIKQTALSKDCNTGPLLFVLITDGYDTGPIPVFLTLIRNPKGLIIFFFMNKANRILPKGKQPVFQQNCLWSPFPLGKRSSASSVHPAGHKGSIKKPQLLVLGRNEEREYWHTSMKQWQLSINFPSMLQNHYQGWRLARNLQQHTTSIWTRWSSSVSQSRQLWGF